MLPATPRGLLRHHTRTLAIGRMSPHNLHLDACTSALDEATALLTQASGSRVIVTAGVQTEGRGRMGRRWHSPPGGLWLAWARVEQPGAASPPWLALAAGNAVADAVCGIGSLQQPALTIKWPNDILLGGRKLAGILCERLTRADGRTALGVGVGLNANVDPAEVAAAADLPLDRVTSLRSHLGRDVDLDSLRSAVVARLDNALCAIPDTASDARLPRTMWSRIMRRLAFLGAEVEVRSALDTITAVGTLRGVDFQGRLLLQTEGGPRHIDSGELSLRPAPRPAAPIDAARAAWRPLTTSHPETSP